MSVISRIPELASIMSAAKKTPTATHRRNVSKIDLEALESAALKLETEVPGALGALSLLTRQRLSPDQKASVSNYKYNRSSKVCYFFGFFVWTFLTLFLFNRRCRLCHPCRSLLVLLVLIALRALSVPTAMTWKLPSLQPRLLVWRRPRRALRVLARQLLVLTAHNMPSPHRLVLRVTLTPHQPQQRRHPRCVYCLFLCFISLSYLSFVSFV